MMLLKNNKRKIKDYFKELDESKAIGLIDKYFPKINQSQVNIYKDVWQAKM